MLKADSHILVLLIFGRKLLHCLLAASNLEHIRHTVGTGKCLGNGDNQVCQLNQLHQNLGHVVHQCHYLTLGNEAIVHPHGSGINQGDGCHIHNEISDRIGQCR